MSFDSSETHPDPAIGRIVHYCFENSRGDIVERPAIIVRVWSDEMVNLQVFTDGTNDAPHFGSVEWRTSVHYSDEGYHHTYHWPNRYDAPRN